MKKTIFMFAGFLTCGLFINSLFSSEQLVDKPVTNTNERIIKAALLWALEKNDIELVKEILEQRSDLISYTTEDLSTPLHIAAFKGHEGIVALLINNNAVVNARRKDNSTPLHCAVENLIGAWYIFNDYFPNGGSSDGSKRSSREREKVEEVKAGERIVKRLVYAQADMQAEEENRLTPLLNAIRVNCVETVKLLIECKADTEEPNSVGKIPLACSLGRKEIMQLLLKQKAENKSNFNQSTQNSSSSMSDSNSFLSLLSSYSSNSSSSSSSTPSLSTLQLLSSSNLSGSSSTSSLTTDSTPGE